MNIKNAKEDIKNTVKMYLKKDDLGEYRIPVVRQRPVFLLGSPGIGKTAIMEQIAAELGLALVSYSMSHHTRQSALGLPYIVKKKYGEEETEITEYTMSEIIASVYETMEQSGLKEGILFLDEINCVSETLAPSMLQFLQYKTFGRHAVPEGWVIITAGNPPEYNRSVREFDVVTLDRLKIMKVEADFDTFKNYGREKGLHGAILGFLQTRKDAFYKVETSGSGRAYVTARGWEDLSVMLTLYEEEEIPVTEELVGQYLHHEEIVKEFTAYYDLFRKYQKQYEIQEILEGSYSDAVVKKAAEAPFDEKISVLSMLTDQNILSMRAALEDGEYLKLISSSLKNSGDQLKNVYTSLQESLRNRKKAGSLSEREERKLKRVCFALEKGEFEYEKVKSAFIGEAEVMKQKTVSSGKKLENTFEFILKAFGEGNELLIFMTELTVSEDASAYIARFGSENYQRFAQNMMLTDRREMLKQEIEIFYDSEEI